MTDTQIVAQDVKAYIENHLHDSLTLSQIAAEFHYSKSSLERIFRREYDMTIMKYHKLCRFREAQRMLKNGASVTDTASILLFRHLESFVRFFKTIGGISPSEYVKEIKHRNNCI